MPALHDFLAKSTRFNALVMKSRRLLVKGESGVSGIRALSRSLSIADDCGGTQVRSDSFAEALRSHGVELDERDIEAVLSVLDRDGEGVLDPVDFIAALRQDLTPAKRAWICRVWYLFHQTPDGSIFIDELMGTFCAEGHPSVVRNECAAQDIKAEFEATFNQTSNPDGVITRQEFEQYYAGVAVTTPDDLSFIELMSGVWPIPGMSNAVRTLCKTGLDPCGATFLSTHTAAQKSSVNKMRQHFADIEQLILSTHRPQVMSAPLAARLLSLALREVDTERSFFIPCDVFTAALWSQRLYVPETYDLSVLDTRGDGSVDILYYMKLLLPQLPPARTMMLERLWALFPKDARGSINVIELHNRFQSKDGEENNDFLSAWDVRRAIQHRVTFEEIVEWYTPSSTQIQLDKDFGILLKRQWSL